MTFTPGHKLSIGKRKTKPCLTKKSGKVWIADQNPDLKPGEVARFADTTTNHLPQLRATKNYKQLTEKFADTVLGKTTMDRMAEINIRNMEQDKDIGGSNNALKMALERIEPENTPKDNQIVNIVFRTKEKKVEELEDGK